MATLLTVAVFGAGIVGRTIAAGWTRAGHRIMLGSRDPGSERIRGAIADLGPMVTAALHADAARATDAAIVTVPADQVDALLGELGDALFARITIDTTNTLAPA